MDAVREARVDVVSFFSPSAVENLRGELGAEVLSRLGARAALAAVGPVTAAALRNAGLPVAIQAAEATAESMATAIVKYFSVAQRCPKRGPHEFSRNAAAPSAAQRSHPVPGARNASFDARLHLSDVCLPRQNVRNPIALDAGRRAAIGGQVPRGMPRSRTTRNSGNYPVWDSGKEGCARQRGLRGGRRRAARHRSGSPRQSESAGHDRCVLVRVHRPRALRHRRERGSEERSDAGIAGGGSAVPRARRRGHHRAVGHDGWARWRDSQGARWRRV